MTGRSATMRWGVRVLVAAVASSALTAGATPPPLSESEEVSQSNTQAVQDALEPCGKAATRAGVYGAVEITIVNGQRPAASAGQTRYLRAADVGCVQRALGHATLTPFGGRRFVIQRWLPIGEVRAVLPGGLLPAWKAAVAERGAAVRKLASLLPPEMRISSPSCLRFHGPEALELALDAWLRKVGRAPASGLVTPSYALPDGWWIRLDEHTRAFDELVGKVDVSVCLDQVDVAVSALRRDRLDKAWVEGADTAFQIEWVVDAAGRAVGDVGFCVSPRRTGPPYTPAEVEALRTRIAARLRGLDYGKRRGYERLVMRYGPEEEMRIEAHAATAPLGRGDSTIEAACDHRAALPCARVAPSASYVPLEIDQRALARCARAWPDGADDLAVILEVRPDGRVITPPRLSSRGLRGPSDRRRTVPPSLSSCVQKVLRRTRFPDSTGGVCTYTTAIASFL